MRKHHDHGDRERNKAGIDLAIIRRLRNKKRKAEKIRARRESVERMRKRKRNRRPPPLTQDSFPRQGSMRSIEDVSGEDSLRPAERKRYRHPPPARQDSMRSIEDDDHRISVRSSHARPSRLVEAVEERDCMLVATLWLIILGTLGLCVWYYLGFHATNAVTQNVLTPRRCSSVAREETEECDPWITELITNLDKEMPGVTAQIRLMLKLKMVGIAQTMQTNMNVPDAKTLVSQNSVPPLKKPSTWQCAKILVFGSNVPFAELFNTAGFKHLCVVDMFDKPSEDSFEKNPQMLDDMFRSFYAHLMSLPLSLLKRTSLKQYLAKHWDQDVDYPMMKKWYRVAKKHWESLGRANLDEHLRYVNPPMFKYSEPLS